VKLNSYHLSIIWRLKKFGVEIEIKENGIFFRFRGRKYRIRRKKSGGYRLETWYDFFKDWILLKYGSGSLKKCLEKLLEEIQSRR